MCRELALVSTTQREIPLPESSCCCHAPISCARAEASSASTGTHSRSAANAVMYIFIGPPFSEAVHSSADRPQHLTVACLLERNLTVKTISEEYRAHVASHRAGGVHCRHTLE